MRQLELMPLDAPEGGEPLKLALDEHAVAELVAAMVQAMLAVLREPGAACVQKEKRNER